MLKEERQKSIMREINLHNKVLSVDLSILLDVSEDTVRRDLKELVDSGKIIKVHGGAISKSLVSNFINDTDIYSHEAKKEIAQKAVSLLKNDMIVLCEGGTTLQEFAKAIPQNIRLTIFTVSPQVAIMLARHSNVEVITIGGKLNKNANVHVGASTINEIATIKADLCIMGVNALNEEGLTDIDLEVVQVNRAMIHHSKKVALLTISEKLNIAKRFTICGLDKINYVVTELSPKHAMLQPYKKKSIQLL